jgi:hypothetical protein
MQTFVSILFEISLRHTLPQLFSSFATARWAGLLMGYVNWLCNYIQREKKVAIIFSPIGK